MNNENNKRKLELPEGLAERLRVFEGRLRVVETVALALGGLCGLLLGFALVFASDRFWDTPLALRLAVLSGCVAAAAWFSARWMRNWLWHRRDARALARLVQKHYPRLGDRLLGAVELAGDAEDRGISPALRRAAIEQVDREAEKYDFKKAVETKKARRYVIGAVVLAALAVAAFVFFPQAGRNALSRWLNPLSETPRYTFVSLEAMPSEMHVAHGEKFTFACELSKLSLWKPVTAECRVGNQPKIVASVRGGRAVFDVPGQTRKETMRVRIGDVSREITVIPVYRPELVKMEADVTLPPYLQLAPRRVVAENGRLKLLAGSRVGFRGTASRGLKTAAAKNGAELKVSVSGERFTTDACEAEKLTPARPEPGTVKFSWTDCYELAGAAPYNLEVSVEDDTAPTLRCEGIAGTVAILADEVIEFKAASSDDYGVQKLWVDWWMDKNEARGLPEIRYAAPLGKGGPDKTAVDGVYRFSPGVLKLPEDVTINFQASTVDYLPGRKPVQSPVYRIVILSRAEHAKLLQQQLQNILSRLEDASREEERLMQTNMELGAQKPADLMSDKTTEDLRADQRGEQSNQRRMDDLARDMADLSKEALRNKDVSEKQLAEWAKLAAEMRKAAGGPMQNASQSLGQAQAQSEAPPRAEDIQKAIEAQKQALEAMKQMQKAGEKSAQNMASRSFVNRLRDTAKAEAAIGAGLKRVLPETVGMQPDELPATVKAEFRRMEGDQKKARTEAQHIRDDLAGFFNRTQEAKYDEVRQAMTEPDVLDSQKRLGEKLQKNLAANSIPDAQTLEKQFNEWADKLEEKEDDGGGQGQGQGQQDKIDPAVIFGLMRARVQEESLREETRTLEEDREKNADYKKLAETLGGKQATLAHDVSELKAKAKDNEKLIKFIEQIGGVMGEVEGQLKKPDTGSDTVAAETVVIEAIAKALESSKKKPKEGDQQQQEQDAQQQAIQQMMEAMMGQQPGMGQEGADAKKGGVPDRGQVGGGDSEGGGAKTGTGVTAGLPEEYKDAIESYFNAVEEKGKGGK